MGITFDKETNQFIFDFHHNGVEDIINLNEDNNNVIFSLIEKKDLMADSI